MNKVYLFSALLIIAFSSCRTPYEPDINTDQQILVVDALLTNQAGSSYVRLTLAIPYDSTGTYPPVQNATVYLTDNNNTVTYFEETSAGYYEPSDDGFAGENNATYVLTVTTSDGHTYESAPETILPSMEPVSVYGGYDKLEYLTKDAFGKTIKVSENVCVTYFDYTGENTTPRFRYNSSQLVEYTLIKNMLFFFNCWKTETDNSLRFTNENYASSSIDVHKQEVCTSPPEISIKVKDIIMNPDINSSDNWIYKDSLIDAYEYKRILEIKQYRLNDDSYAYYKEVKSQSDAEGKIFDPIISQLQGNIACATDASKPVFGFFEASNLSNLYYVIRRNGLGSTVSFIRINSVAPHTNEGFLLEQVPDFWIR
jgi:hypothetical protein